MKSFLWSVAAVVVGAVIVSQMKKQGVIE